MYRIQIKLQNLSLLLPLKLIFYSARIVLLISYYHLSGISWWTRLCSSEPRQEEEQPESPDGSPRGPRQLRYAPAPRQLQRARRTLAAATAAATVADSFTKIRATDTRQRCWWGLMGVTMYLRFLYCSQKKNNDESPFL